MNINTIKIGNSMSQAFSNNDSSKNAILKLVNYTRNEKIHLSGKNSIHEDPEMNFKFTNGILKLKDPIYSNANVINSKERDLNFKKVTIKEKKNNVVQFTDEYNNRKKEKFQTFKYKSDVFKKLETLMLTEFGKTICFDNRKIKDDNYSFKSMASKSIYSEYKPIICLISSKENNSSLFFSKKQQTFTQIPEVKMELNKYLIEFTKAAENISDKPKIEYHRSNSYTLRSEKYNKYLGTIYKMKMIEEDSKRNNNNKQNFDKNLKDINKKDNIK
jgi:hypothetical protein